MSSKNETSSDHRPQFLYNYISGQWIPHEEWYNTFKYLHRNYNTNLQKRFRNTADSQLTGFPVTRCLIKQIAKYYLKEASPRLSINDLITLFVQLGG